MTSFNWRAYIGRTVSLLINGKAGKMESFIGTLVDVDGSLLEIDPNNPNFTIERFLIDTSLIKSAWLYKDIP